MLVSFWLLNGPKDLALIYGNTDDGRSLACATTRQGFFARVVKFLAYLAWEEESFRIKVCPQSHLSDPN